MQNICYQMTRKAVLALTMVLACALPALAQKITVSGTVYEPEGEPAISASVLVQGQQTGVVTDYDGNYSIEVDANGTLVFSYIGCDTQTIAVNGQTTINVHLSANTTILQEVVAVGYGQVKKSDATGSVAVVKPDEIEAGIATSTQDLLVGASPGVVVTVDGGNPAGGGTIRVRGGSSLNATNDPLIVIDGVPQTNQSNGGGANALTMINPSNIASMTILKDASATAIYGSRASNGVIIITTKQGTSKRPQVDFSANFSVNTARNTLNMMDAAQFRNAVTNLIGSADAIGKLGESATDWQKEVLRTTFSHDYNLSVGGRANGWFPYRFSVSFTNNEGILKTSSMQRTTVGFNLAPKFFDDHLSVTANATGTYVYTGNADTGAIGAAVAYDPTQAVRTAYATEGNTGLTMYNGYTQYAPGGIYDQNATRNPVAMLEETESHNKSFSSTGNLQIDYSLHFLPELHLNLNVGYQVSRNFCESITDANSVAAWTNDQLNVNNSAGAGTRYKWYELQRNTLLDFYANYKKDFEALKSSVDLTAGYSWQRFDYHGHSNTYVNTVGFVKADGSNGFDVSVDPETGAPTYYYDWNTRWANGEGVTQTVGNAPDSQWANPLQLMSWFGRLNYIFDDTYLLTVTLRNDASSRFSKDTRWGLFPAVALGWKISNLPVFKDSNVLNEWKLRLGWGKTGQQDIGSYFPYMPVYVTSNTNGFLYPGVNGGWVYPIYPNAYDANIKWETTTTWNAGMDFAFLNNRITASIDWYLRDTDDLLANTPSKGMQTSNYLTTNIGSLRNYGVEFNISARPVVTNDFTWTSALNVAWNRNKITALSGDAANDMVEARGLPSGTGGTLQWHMPGEAAYTYRVYQQVYNDAGEPIPGQYVDQNADGKIDEKDLINYHSPDPKVTLSFNNNFRYKNWDFGISLRANIGNWVYNNPRYERTRLDAVSRYDLTNLMADEFLFPTTVDKLNLSDYFVENASFLRCDNITVGYTFENLLQDRLRLRLFGACQNPFVITKYKGLDPEIYEGIDNNCYPRPITFTLGVIATF